VDCRWPPTENGRGILAALDCLAREGVDVSTPEEYFPTLPKIELNARGARAGCAQRKTLPKRKSFDAWVFDAPAEALGTEVAVGAGEIEGELPGAGCIESPGGAWVIAPMSPASPRTMLADALRKLAGSPAAAVQIADRAGDNMRCAVQRARAGKAINAGAHLALCGIAGLDPVDGSPRPVKRVPAHVSWPMVGAGLKIMRRLRHQDQRSAAKMIGISAATLCRVEAGAVVSIETLLAVCRFVGTHPEHYSTS
jgi:hypothetical protein